MEWDDECYNMSYNDNEEDRLSDDADFATFDSPDRNDRGARNKVDNKNSTCESEERYTILNESDIKLRQDEEISNVSSVLSLSMAESTVLLCHYNWSTSQLHDDWFSNEQLVRSKVGLFTNNVRRENNSENHCGICFDDDISRDQIRSASCGHCYCKTCWRSYIDLSINEMGPGCLSLKCPEPKCTASVDRDMVSKLSSKEAQKKYLHYLIRSYVEFKKLKVKWCPAPGCGNAVEFELGSDVYDIVCDCGNEFCFNCGEEPHRPVECKIVKEWILKNSSEAENVKWIMAFSKPCPKCKRPIEKTSGCNHMTCGEPCKHHFCWHCGRDLYDIANYSCNCNGYSQHSSKLNDEDAQMKMAKQCLERYAHYYERWASNNKSRDKALADLTEMKDIKVHVLCDNLQHESALGLEFILKAWEKIVECRRILKWTYAYGYFLFEQEHTKRQLFEYLQGEAERALERLHYCAERDFQVFFDDVQDGASADAGAEDVFDVFRVKLVDLTKVTGSFFENLVRGLENGLSEVWEEPEQEQKRLRGSSSNPEEQYRGAANQEIEYWSCDRCSYRNPVWAFTCEICFEGL